MDIVRTPDDRFDGLPGYPFAPHYVDVPRGDGTGETLRIHVVDEGPRDATETVLLLHGEPSWSYLYRTMIPVITAAGFRAVAPDLVGFGRSDKPTAREDYTYQRHVDWIRAVIEALDLRHITLVCQDWGGLIGLRLAAEEPDRFARVVAANTFLPTGDSPPGEAFLNWQRFSQEVPDFAVGQIVNMGTTSDLSPEVIAAYDAPFPDDSYKAGARPVPDARPDRAGRPGLGGQPGGLGPARAMEEALPDRVLRRRPDQQGRRPRAAGADPGRERPGAHHDRGRRALPPGGPRARARARRRRLHHRNRGHDMNQQPSGHPARRCCRAGHA